MGHVEAETKDRAYHVLADNGIVAEGLVPDPVRTDDSHQPGLASAIDQALAQASRPIPFNALRGQYEGKHVWIVDREKIKRRVLETVDEVIRQSRGRAEDDNATHDRLTKALERLFGDNRNLTSPASAQQQQQASAAQQQAIVAQQEATAVQLSRLEEVVRQLEHAVGSIRSATRFPGVPAGDGFAAGRAARQRRHDPDNDRVLREIFQTNVELRRRLDAEGDEGPAEADNAA